MNILKIIRNPYLVSLLALLVLSVSCTKNEDLGENGIAKNIIQKKVKNIKLINDFVKMQKSKLNSKSLNIEFDNSNVYEISIDESNNFMIMANQINFNENNVENYAISAVQTNNGFSEPLVVRTEKISDEIFQIDYLDFNFELIYSVQLDSTTESINVLFQKDNFDKLAGQDVMDCLNDVYSNHGWLSVWTFVQTAFIPATALLLAAACAGANA